MSAEVPWRAPVASLNYLLSKKSSVSRVYQVRPSPL
jgi:hypothetical protein